MSVIPYLSQGIGVPIDPRTGLPQKKKQPANPRLGLSPAQGLAQSNQIAGGFSPNLAGSMFGGFGSAGQAGVPDYKALINEQLGPFRMELGAQGVADRAGLTSATQRALILSGAIPDFQGGAPPGLDTALLDEAVTPQTRQLAQQNTEAGLSIKARQDKAFKDQVRQIKNALASRGALRSGETGYQLQEAQLGRDQASFDTVTELTEFLAGLQAGFAEKERARKLQEAGAAADAEGRVRELYPAQAPQGGNTGGQLPPQGAPPAAAPPPPSPAPLPPTIARTLTPLEGLLASMVGSGSSQTLADVFDPSAALRPARQI